MDRKLYRKMVKIDLPPWKNEVKYTIVWVIEEGVPIRVIKYTQRLGTTNLSILNNTRFLQGLWCETLLLRL